MVSQGSVVNRESGWRGRAGPTEPDWRLAESGFCPETEVAMKSKWLESRGMEGVITCGHKTCPPTDSRLQMPGSWDVGQTSGLLFRGESDPLISSTGLQSKPEPADRRSAPHTGGGCPCF